MQTRPMLFNSSFEPLAFCLHYLHNGSSRLYYLYLEVYFEVVFLLSTQSLISTPILPLL